MHRRLGSANQSQTALLGQSKQNSQWEKYKWDKTVVKESNRDENRLVLLLEHYTAAKLLELYHPCCCRLSSPFSLVLALY